MYKYIQLLSVTLLSIFVLFVSDLDARGGGRGGGGGGGGGRGGGGGGGGRSLSSHGGGRSVHRSPSMSRSVARAPSRPQSVQRSVATQSVQRPQVYSGSSQRLDQRPQVSQGRVGQPSQLDAKRSQIGSTVAKGSGATRERTLETRNQVNNFMQNNRGSASQLPSNLGAKSQLTQGLSDNRQQFQQNRPQRLDARRDSASQIRDRIDRGDVRDRIEDHWDDYHWGNYAPWAAVAGLGAWGWYDSPYYYDYAYGDPNPYVYTDTGATVSYPQTVPAAPAVAPQQSSAAYYPPESSVSSPSQGQETWLPLGIFALTTKGQPTVDPVFYLKISINNKGELDGQILNITTNVVHDVAGLVDPKTQLAAWKIENNPDSPIMETGIYNLTLAESPLQVDFTNGSSQEWLMVRVDSQKTAK